MNPALPEGSTRQGRWTMRTTKFLVSDTQRFASLTLGDVLEIFTPEAKYAIQQQLCIL